MPPALYFEPAANARPLTELPLLIVVGLTGVGKTSFIRALGWPALPNRRALVDRFILPRLGADPARLDRADRFALTARWRASHPGGLAEALAAAYAAPTWPLVFDGLRGEAEVRFAHERFPRARFAVLEAPVAVRLERLLDRREGFDRIAIRPEEVVRFRELAGGVLEPGAIDRLLGRGYPLEQLVAKLKIVAEEQKNYHPEGPRRALAGSERALFLDTVAQDPAAIAARVRTWLGEA